MNSLTLTFCAATLLDGHVIAAQHPASPALSPASAMISHGLVVHEWGTFTSVQGPDGVLLSWRPLETSRLPEFVYDWSHPGLGRPAVGALVFNKGSLQTLQRMETPVLYFYTEREQQVEVSVRFPQGLVTEWYPQAAQLGRPEVAVPADQSLKITGTDTLVWRGVTLLPPGKNPPALRGDSSGSHYFSARETDAAILKVDGGDGSNAAPEYERFLFYRGVGNFSTPLRVTTEPNNRFVLANTGSETIERLCVLCVRAGMAGCVWLEHLSPGEHREASVDFRVNGASTEEVSRQLGKDMAQALTKEGLYEKEAQAMVKTWKDSWFTEDGARVLYLLPRAWTDHTLPLTVQPEPERVVRVMVGRAEVLTPELEQGLAEAMREAESKEPAAQAHLHAQLRVLGRFAEPALFLATRYTNALANTLKSGSEPVKPRWAVGWPAGAEGPMLEENR